MAKKLLLVPFVVLGTCIIVWGLCQLARPKTPSLPFVEPAPEVQPADHLLRQLERVNSACARVSSLACDNVDLTLEQRLTFSLKGWLRYEKPRNFRLACGMRGRPECDIGSNRSQFWFWSKRSKPAALFYCDHARTLETRLRTPLHPLWIMECLGLNGVPTKDIRVTTTHNGLAVHQRRAGTLGNAVTMVTYADAKNLLVTGHALLDKDSKAIASSRVLSWQSVSGLVVPRAVEVTWHEEGVRIVLSLNSPSINCRMSPEAWALPRIQPAINMADY